MHVKCIKYRKIYLKNKKWRGITEYAWIVWFKKLRFVVKKIDIFTAFKKCGDKKYHGPLNLCVMLNTVGAVSQWWTNERMMVYFKLMLVKCSLWMMMKFSLMMVKWVYDHARISPSLTSISPSLTKILPSLAWSKPSFANLTIVEKLHRL